jgi:hypothetical protein
MRDYGKVHTAVWASDTIRALSDDGKMLAMYLMTSPHSTIAGVFHLPDGYVCEDIRWSLERVIEGFKELFREGFANRCETTKWVWVNKHLDWNPPENPNQRKSAAKVAQSVPDKCCWKAEFMRVCGPSLGVAPAEKANPSSTVGEPLPNQDQKQDQKQDMKARVPALAIPGVSAELLADYLEVRKGKRAGKITGTVVAALEREAGRAGISVPDAVKACCEFGWQGFNAQWYAERVAKSGGGADPYGLKGAL